MKAPVTASAPPVAHARVLIVEDEPRMREMLERALREIGFIATAVGSAEQAVRALARGAAALPHIVLLDLNLPGMGGLELLQHVRERLPSAAIVVLTGFGSLDAAKVAIRHDVVDFLTKPCRLDELEVAMARAGQRVAQPLLEERARASAESVTPVVVPPAATLEELEWFHIQSALDRHDGNRAAAASELGISERTLYYRLARCARRPD